MKFIALLFGALLLAGCGSGLEKLITIENTIYPELPPVPVTAKLQLQKCEWDRPRKEFDIAFDPELELWIAKPLKMKDGEYPIDTNSKILMGYTAETKPCFIENMARIRAKMQQLESRIDAVNEQRLEWKQRNEENK